jgi:hypothetical protein
LLAYWHVGREQIRCRPAERGSGRNQASQWAHLERAVFFEVRIHACRYVGEDGECEFTPVHAHPRSIPLEWGGKNGDSAGPHNVSLHGILGDAISDTGCQTVAKNPVFRFTKLHFSASLFVF